KWERKLKKGGARCKHRPPPKMTHQQDLTKSHLINRPAPSWDCQQERGWKINFFQPLWRL
ncbi:hypothetical protein, partial [Limosilactobacillus fermentum]|uniref:hypothetical protein n=1 Tax=Limosilactobacillus fermentum TaxID=1613 RepID=UPI0021A6EACF